MSIFGLSAHYLRLTSFTLIAIFTSSTAHADIYKWRDISGVLQYADKPPSADFSKATPQEIVNGLQTKNLCAEPVTTAIKSEIVTKQASVSLNFYGNQLFGSNNGSQNNRNSNNTSAANRNSWVSGGGLTKSKSNTPLKPIGQKAALPVNIKIGSASPINKPVYNQYRPFGGSSLFQVGNKNVGVFGLNRPIKLAATKPVTAPLPVNPVPIGTKPISTMPTTPLPVVTDPKPEPASPLVVQAPPSANGNIVQVGLMPAVDISKNMTPAIGANEPFIGSYDPPAPGDGDGQFRTACLTSHMSNDDPIVYPNQQGAAHHHTFFGNTSTNYKSDVANMAKVGNATCTGGTINRSAYWIPSMIDTATKTPLVPGVAVWYYKTGYMIKREKITPPPKGLRMIAGDMRASKSQRENEYKNNAFYRCNLANGGSSTTSDSIPACPQGASLSLVVQFPQCWDGKNLDSPDHKSHMAYPVSGELGCPASHPVAIPNITFNVHYNITTFGGTANWRLSSDNYAKNGYNGGYSSHADWINGWDENTMKIVVKNCLNGGPDCGMGNFGNGFGLWAFKDRAA